MILKVETTSKMKTAPKTKGRYRYVHFLVILFRILLKPKQTHQLTYKTETYKTWAYITQTYSTKPTKPKLPYQTKHAKSLFYGCYMSYFFEALEALDTIQTSVGSPQ